MTGESTARLYLVGTAGSGKTTLVSGFRDWMTSQRYDCIVVNLDPGVEKLPYEPDIDIREWVRLQDVMDEHDLGPNGAQVACSDLLALKASEVRKVMDSFKTDYFLIDTPGQIELVAFRESSRVTVDALGRDEAVISFLYDPMLSRSASGFVSNLLLATTVQFRFYTPCLHILSKADLLDQEMRDRVLEWASDYDELHKALIAEEPSMLKESGIGFLRALMELETTRTLMPVSSTEGFGYEDLYNAVQQLFAGGDDLDQR